MENSNQMEVIQAVYDEMIEELSGYDVDGGGDKIRDIYGY